MELFDQGKIGMMHLKNRIIMTAIHTGFSMEEEKKFLALRARGGAAAVTAVMGVSPSGTYRNMEILKEENKQLIIDLAETIHNEEGRLIVQLFHAGRNASPDMLIDPGESPLAPSPVPSPIFKWVPKALSIAGIDGIINDFANSAELCKQSGVDAVEISCSAGYLLSEFISSNTNQRDDQYGGSLDNRIRFPMATVEAVRNAVGKDYPVILRVSAGDMTGGYGIEETLYFLEKAEPFIDAINVTGGWHESSVPQISMYLPEGGFAMFAGMVKRQARVPVIACNRINNGATAQEVLEGGYADFVGCARSFLIDAEFANKVFKGIPSRRCIGCNKGCIERVLKLQEAQCVFNPNIKEVKNETEKPKRKKILVIGGGPAGMEAAISWGWKGHEVCICTSEQRLGGQMELAGKIPNKGAILENINVMEHEMKELGIDICLNTEGTPDFIEALRPDLVIVATGSKPWIPEIPGIDLPHVWTAEKVLRSSEADINRLLQKKVVIIGGGAVGLETALYLAKKNCLFNRSHDFLMNYKIPQTDFDISIIELSEKAGNGLGGMRRAVLKELEDNNISLCLETCIKEIKREGIVLVKSGVCWEMEAESVVLAMGYRPNGKALIRWLMEKKEYPFKVIGDANGGGSIEQAMKGGSEIMFP